MISAAAESPALLARPPAEPRLPLGGRPIRHRELLQAPALWPVGAGIEYAFADNLTAKLATTL